MNTSLKTAIGSRPQSTRGFTLIEMIGVLAVIAILAALLVPKVFSAINDARVNGTCISCDTVKTAVADHYGKYGKFDFLYGTNQLTMPIYGYDTNMLMPEGLLDKPFVSRVAGGDPAATSHVELVPGASSGSGAASGWYDLAGYGSNMVSGAAFVLEVHLQNVTAQDAKDLNDRIDGTALGVSSGADNKGRVEYTAPANGVVSDLYVYLTHR